MQRFAIAVLIMLAMSALAQPLIAPVKTRHAGIAGRQGGGGSAYWTDPNDFKIIAKWDFEGTNSVQTLDASSQGYHNDASNLPSVISGAVWLTASNQFNRIEHWYSFDGGDDCFRTSAKNNGFASTSSQIVVAAWCMLGAEAVGAAAKTICAQWNIEGDSKYSFFLSFNGNGNATSTNRPTWQIYNGSTLTTSLGNVMPTGQWMHVAGVYDGTNSMLYVNGLQVDQDAIAGGLNSYAARVDIGSVLGTAPWQGYMDDVRIYTNCISSNDMFTLVSKTHPTNNLVQR